MSRCARTLLFTIFATGVACGQTNNFTWNGNSGFSDNWNDVFNWDGFNPPPLGNPLGSENVLIGASGSSVSNLQDNYSVDNLTFLSSLTSGISITGQNLTIRDGRIENEDGNRHTFNNAAVILQGTHLDIHTFDAASGDLDFNAPVQLSAGAGSTETLRIQGNNDVLLDGGIVNTVGGGVGTINVTKSGTGQLRLRNDSTGINDLTIFGGEVFLSGTAGQQPTLSPSLDVNVLSGAVFDLNGNSRNIDKLEGAGTVQLSGATLTLGDAADFSFSGVLENNGATSSIIKNQSGTMILAGSNTYTGATTIDAGTIRLSGSGRISNSSDVVVNSGATFDLDGVTDTVDSISGAGSIRLGGAALTVDEISGTRTFSGDVLENGTLRKNGNGTLVLSGNNEMSLLDINFGVLRATSSGAFGNGTIDLSATLEISGNVTNSRPIGFSDFGGTFDINNGSTLTQSGVVSGNSNHNLIKTDNGTLILSGNNTYTGDTLITDGTLRLGGNNRISNSSDVVLSSGATFDLNGFDETVRTLSGLGGTVDTGSDGVLTVGTNLGVATFGGSVTGDGGLTKVGNDTLVLSGSSTNTGPTSILDGKLTISTDHRLSDLSDVVISSGANLDLDGEIDRVASISGSGDVLLGGGVLALQSPSGSFVFTGDVLGNGELEKNGDHILQLAGTNTFTKLDINNGVVRVSDAGDVGAGVIELSSPSGQDATLEVISSFANPRGIDLASTGGAVDVNTLRTLTQTARLSGGSGTTLVKKDNGTFVMGAGSASGSTFSGNIRIEQGTFEIGAGSGDALNANTDFTINSGGTLLVSEGEIVGAISGSGNIIANSAFHSEFDTITSVFSGVISGSNRFEKQGNGTLVLGGANTYQGVTNLREGILRLSGNGGLPDTTDLTIFAAGTWDLNGVNDTIDALNGTGSVDLGSATATVGAAGGSGSFSGGISGSGSFHKTGDGTQTLSGTNTYAGSTRVSGGALQVAGNSNLGAGSIELSGGGALEPTASFDNGRTVALGPGQGIIDVASGLTFTQSGNATGSGGLTKEGDGSLLLSGANNSFAGPVLVNDGILASLLLPDSTNVTVATGAAWSSLVADQVATIAGGGLITINGGAITVGGDVGSTVFSGTLTGNGNFIKTGEHSLQLSGNNTYVGPTEINGGVLSISADNNLGNALNHVALDSGALEVSSGFTSSRNITLGSAGGTFSVLGVQHLGLTGGIGGTGALTKSGLGTLTLSGNNTYAGQTNIHGGTLVVNSDAGLGAGDLFISGGALRTAGTFVNQRALDIGSLGASIEVDLGHTLTHSAEITGVGEFTKDGLGTLLLDGITSYSGPTSVDAATLRLLSGGLPDTSPVTVRTAGTWDLNGVSDTIDSLNGDGTVLLGGATLTLGENDAFFDGSIQGAGSVVKTGQGNQEFDGNNTYTGETVLAGNALIVTSNNNLGAPSTPLRFDNGILETNGTFTAARDVTLDALGTFDVNGGTTLTLDNPVIGPGGLRKRRSGTLVLNGQNTYSGPTTVEAGTLRISGAGQLGQTDISVASGATLDISDLVLSVGSLQGSGNVELGSGTLTLNGGGAYSGVISGVGGKLTKDGPGTLTLSGINTYTGDTCILDGAISISQTENLGELGSVVTFDGGTLITTASFGMIRGMALNPGGGNLKVLGGTALDASGNITGDGTLFKTGGGDLTLSGFSSYTGGTQILDGKLAISSNVNLGNGAGSLHIDGGTLHATNNISMSRPTTLGSAGATLQTDASTLLTQSGVISGNPGSAGLTKSGAGTLRLQGDNSFTGDVHVNAGTLQVDATEQLGDGSNVISITGATLNTIASLDNGRTVQLNDSATVNTIDVSASVTFTQSGPIVDGGTAAQEALVKTGTGTLRTTAVNTYSSATRISAGRLQLAGGGQLPDTTDLTVNASATLDLNGVDDAIDALDGGGDIELGSGTLTVGADNGGSSPLRFNGLISGSGGLVKTGTGTQILRARLDQGAPVPNSFLGGVEVNGGELNVNGDVVLGDPSGTLTLDGGRLHAVADGLPLGNVTTARPVVLGPGGGTFDVDEPQPIVSLSGLINGPGSLTKEGLGLMRIRSSALYGGSTNINLGNLELTENGRLPDTTDLTIDSAAALILNVPNDAINALNGDGTVNLNENLLTLGTTGGNGSFFGQIIGAGQLAKSGSGIQKLNTPNFYSGGTLLHDGVLEVDADDRLGASAGTLTFDGGTLRATSSFPTSRPTTLASGGGTFETSVDTILNHNVPITGNGGLTKAGSGRLILEGINTYTGPTQVSGGELRLGGIERLSDVTDVTVDAGAIFDLNGFNESVGALSGNGDVQLQTAQLVIGLSDSSGNFGGVISGTGDVLKEGTGVQTLTGQNTYAGATFVDGGEFVLASGGTIEQTTLVVGFNIGSNGTTRVSGLGTRWDLSGNLQVGLDGTAVASIEDEAVVAVEGTVQVGTLNQGTASAGLLSLASGGSLDNSSGDGIDVVNGALQGHGDIIGNISNFDRLAPGESAGILSVVGSVVQNTGATLAIEIGGTDNSNPANPDFDMLDVTGNLALDGALEVSLLNGFAPDPADTFRVADSGLLIGAFGNVASGTRVDLISGGTGSFLVNYGNGSPFGPNLIVLSDFDGTASISADFNGDGALDCLDIDDLAEEIAAATHGPAFDLTGDGFVNQSDLDQWLADAGAANLASGNPYLPGDANLDGNVNGPDFVTWNNNKFTPTTGWCSGDFNADGFVNGPDFVIWNNHKFMSADNEMDTAPVPEPSMYWLVLVGSLAAFWRCRVSPKCCVGKPSAPRAG